MWQWLIAWQDWGLILYACFKAFLPLPSLEILLFPLCAAHPERYIRYALEGAIGTAAGGWLGYMLASWLGYKVLSKFSTEAEIAHGKEIMDQYGVYAVFIGGITPIPDFLLAYLAGMMRMNIVKFLLADGTARLIRSLIVGYFIKTMSVMIDMDRYGMVISVCLVAYLMYRYLITKYRRGKG